MDGIGIAVQLVWPTISLSMNVLWLVALFLVWLIARTLTSHLSRPGGR
jgi:hypothetical protein